jgi:hypothetical protein
MPHEQIQGLLQIPQGQAHGIDIQEAIQHALQALLVTNQDVPLPLGVPAPEFRDTQIGNPPIGGEHLATEKSRTMLPNGLATIRQADIAIKAEFCGQFFLQGGFQSGPYSNQCTLSEVGFERIVQFILKRAVPDPLDLDFHFGYGHGGTSAG